MWLMLMAAVLPVAHGEEPHPQLRMAHAAQQAGDIGLAEFYLEDLLRQDIDKNIRMNTVNMLAEVYWSQGKDKLLVDFTERELGRRESKMWWCRVLERRGNAKAATTCWNDAGEIARMERALRSSTIVEELAPPKTYSGHRAD